LPDVVVENEFSLLSLSVCVCISVRLLVFFSPLLLLPSRRLLFFLLQLGHCDNILHSCTHTFTLRRTEELDKRFVRHLPLW